MHGDDSRRASDPAARLRGFGPAGLAAMGVILAGGLLGPPVAAVLVLAWARMSETPWAALGFRAPRSWALTLAGGVVFGALLKIAAKAIVLPLLGAPAVNARYHFLAGNPAALPGMIATILVSAAFAEEVFFRGWMFERLGRLLGDGRAARVATVGIAAALFALAHLPDQGGPGVEQAAFTGLVFGTVFARWRSLWFLVAAHAAFDLVALAIIYAGLEERVAHLLFR